MHLSTYWQALERPERDFKLFVHLRDAAGNTVAAFDHYPFTLRQEFLADDIELNAVYLAGAAPLPAAYPATGMIPTSLWLPGNTLVETVALPLPADLAPGAYTLALGLYDENSMERLPITDATGAAQGEITLGSVQVR